MHPHRVLVLECLSLILKCRKTDGCGIERVHSKVRASRGMCRLALVADDLAHKAVAASLPYHDLISYGGMMCKIDVDVIEGTNSYQLALATAVSYFSLVLEFIFKLNLAVLLGRNRKENHLTVKCLCNLLVCKRDCRTHNSGKLAVMSTAMCAVRILICIFMLRYPECVQLTYKCKTHIILLILIEVALNACYRKPLLRLKTKSL